MNAFLHSKILLTVACVVIPVAWGIFVNWVFDLWRERTCSRPSDDSAFPDYQI